MKYIWMPLVALCLSACSPPEYMETKNYCAAIWNKKIPEKIELRVRDRTRIEERPTGKSTCWFNGRKNVCQQEMRRVYVDYQEIVEEDVNSFERNSEIQYCTYKKCMADYGNEDCKTE